MSHPSDINLNTYEKMNSMKNMFGNSIIEILKPNIKSHQNESVIKMLEIAKDKPETYLELLSVAIFHRNMDIIKYMVEKLKITEGDSPFMNALSFYNSILPENSENKLNDVKENYNLIQCPFVIMSGIGGDIEIFKYLSKKNLISNINEIGIVGLSKKLKNGFFSNIIGACCYYGRPELLEFILKNNKIDINLPTTEKKSKSGFKVGFSKEYSGLTPSMLSVVGPINDLETVKILKILNNYNCKFKGVDHNKDNILHLATKNKKIETAKYLVDELDMKGLMGDNNREGYTPMSLAQHLNNEIFINYFSDKEKVDEKEIEENLKELIDESNKIKDKNNKRKKKKNNKNKDDEPFTLNSSEYQETLKEFKTVNSKKKSNNYYDNYQEEFIQDESSKIKKTKNTKRNDNNDYKIGDNSEKLKALLEKPKTKKKKEKKENIINNNINNIEVKEDKKEKKEEKKEMKENIQEKEKNNKTSIKHEEDDDEIIIGLGSKNKKNKKLKKNKTADKEKEEEEKIKMQKDEEERKKREEEEQKRKIEEEEEMKRLERERELEEARQLEELRKIEEEEKEKERIKKLKEEELKRKQREEELERKRKEEELKRKKKEEEEERKQKEIKELNEKHLKEKEKESNEINEESEESDGDDYSSEKNFLSEHEDSKEKEEKQYIDKEDYDKLNKKYLELERRISILEKEKEEMNSLIRTLFLQNKTNMQIPITENKEENINDLMSLANKELENKNKVIHELEGKVSKLNLNNVNEFSKEKLKEYKDFYTKKLKTINDALKQY